MDSQIKIEDNNIWIGKKLISFPTETTIQKAIKFSHVVCFNTWPKENDLKWNNSDTNKIWEVRCLNNPSKLFCYDYSGTLKWEFPYDQVVGIEPEIPELKKPEEFISEDAFFKFRKEFSGKELLIVYAGNYRYRINANTGEIYGKVVSM